MSDETLNTLKLRAKGYERYLECNYHHYDLEEEIAHEVITRFNDYEKEIDKLKKQLEKKYSKTGTLTNEVLYEENTKLINQQKEFIDYMENKIYSIEPKGTGINYNCEYDSEEDFISAMEEQSRLNTLKEILSKYKEIIGKNINVTTKGEDK